VSAPSHVPPQAERIAFESLAFPPDGRFAAWQAFWRPVIEVRPPDGAAAADFAARAVLWRIGRLVLADVEADPARYRRTRRQAQRDGMEHWVVGAAGDGGAGAARLLLAPLARGFRLEATARRWTGVFLPPERLAQCAAHFAAPRSWPASDAQGRMLAGMLPRMAMSVAAMEAAQAGRLEEALLALITVGLSGRPAPSPDARAQLEAVRRARVIALIDAALGDPGLDTARLVAHSGLSRSELYRCFAPAGGIARAIQRRRLRRAHAYLSLAEAPVPIGQVGERVGFPDPSSFTRAFRREFGCTPSELIGLRAAGQGTPLPGLALALRERRA
jgi:AraC-like DNA-binding protein